MAGGWAASWRWVLGGRQFCSYYGRGVAPDRVSLSIESRFEMEPDFEAESWESTGPSYVQSYVVSAFILIGILTIASNRVPATPLSILFFSVWFGAFFYWLVQNRRAERTFASD